VVECSAPTATRVAQGNPSVTVIERPHNDRTNSTDPNSKSDRHRPRFTTHGIETPPTTDAVHAPAFKMDGRPRVGKLRYESERGTRVGHRGTRERPWWRMLAVPADKGGHDRDDRPGVIPLISRRLRGGQSDEVTFGFKDFHGKLHRPTVRPAKSQDTTRVARRIWPQLRAVEQHIRPVRGRGGATISGPAR